MSENGEVGSLSLPHFIAGNGPMSSKTLASKSDGEKWWDVPEKPILTSFPVTGILAA